jgi:hypothetical protein
MRVWRRVLLITAVASFSFWSDRSPAQPATILTVTNNADSGEGSLRQVITDANTDSPPVLINFAIPPFGSNITIALLSPLPTITNPTTINGFSQSGAYLGSSPGTLTNIPVILITVDGSSGLASNGFVVAASAVVEGLTIQNFTTGTGLVVSAGATLFENVISSNSVGIEVSGLTNTCAGNALVHNAVAISVTGSNNTFAANLITNSNAIGVNVAGDNNGFSGDLISSNSNVGVIVNGNNNTFSNEIVSANGSDGVDIQAAGNIVFGCTVSSNALHGVNIGGLSGIFGVSAASNVVSGVTAFANGGDGVILGGGSNSLMGSTISSNAGDGVFVLGLGHTVGGAASGAGNVISANAGNGVDIAGYNVTNSGPTASDFNVVQGNLIGTDVTTTNNLGNSQSGVLIDGTLAEASTNLIGGEFSGQPNLIAFNNSNGVTVVSNAVANAIFGNSISNNAGLGIELGTSGVTSNYPFGVVPSGPNNFQNYPVLASAICSNSGLLIQGSITSSVASTPEHIEFFANAACDPSGFGQGQVFIGTADVTTDLSGGASFSVPFASSSLVGQYITATASDSSSNTSEFSQCILVPHFTNTIVTINNCTNIAVSASSTQLSAVVTFPTPTATDVCAATATVTCVPSSGSIFPLGTTPVVCTAVDPAGNTATCTFQVTLTAPQQVIVDIAPGICPVVINTNQGGVVQVAIVGSQSLNVTNIIPASVALNGVLAGTNFFIADVAAPFVYTRGCSKKKHGPFPDLVVEFDVKELVASLGTVKNGERRVLTVNGTVNVIGTNGIVVGTTTFEGQDEIKISTKKSHLPKGLKNPF